MLENGGSKVGCGLSIFSACSGNSDSRQGIIRFGTNKERDDFGDKKISNSNTPCEKQPSVPLP